MDDVDDIQTSSWICEDGVYFTWPSALDLINMEAERFIYIEGGLSPASFFPSVPLAPIIQPY